MTTYFPDLAGRATLLTGAGEGIGRAIAEALCQSGAHVVLNDIDPDLARAAAEEITAEGPGRCVAVPGDAGDVEVIDRMVATCLGEFGRLDSAVANAGITVFGDFDDVSPAAFDRLMNVNLRGSYFLTQRAVRAMRDLGRPGRIVLMSSNVGIQAYPKLSAYSMTKSALQMMARSLVVELGAFGVTINALAPGATLTERTKLEQDDYAGVWSKLVPRGKIAMPADIANSCLFLLSNASAHVNGVTLVVDGGWSATSPLPQEVASEHVNTTAELEGSADNAQAA